MPIVLKSGSVFHCTSALHFNEKKFNEILFYVKPVDIFTIICIYKKAMFKMLIMEKDAILHLEV